MTNSDTAKTHHSSSDTHRRVQSSTTLNRKYVRRPSLAREQKITSIAKKSASDLERRQALAEQINREKLMRLNAKQKAAPAPRPVASVSSTSASRTAAANIATASTKKAVYSKTSQTAKRTATTASMADRKNDAIKSALSSVATMDKNTKKTKSTFKVKRAFDAKKIILAFACATASVVAIGYFVSLNVPDVSVRVAAMQSGLDASYPSYIPRDFTLASVSSEDGKIIMEFSNQSDSTFTLTEEKSSWDSSALESNYIKDAYGTNYTALREQGLTIFISGSDAAWVNGGIVYKITASGSSLTKKQIKTIATSL